MFGLIPRVPGHLLEENSDLPNLDPEGRFRWIAEMRHKCRMAAIETAANAKIKKSLIGRSRPMCGNYVPGDLVYSWRAGNGVHQAQGQWLGPTRVTGIEGRNVWVSHRATVVKCAKEQLRMASPAEREMREMLMELEETISLSAPNMTCTQTAGPDTTAATDTVCVSSVFTVI